MKNINHDPNLRPAASTLSRITGSANPAVEEQIRSLLDDISDLVLVLGPGGVVHFASASLPRVLGYSADEVVGRAWSDLLSSEDLPRWTAAMREAELSPGKSVFAEERVRHQDGSWRQFESRYRLLRNDTGAPLLLLTGRDVTERRQVEARFLRAERLDKIGTLAEGIAHDLNNIFSPILMSIQFLRETVAEDQKSLVATLEKSAHRGAAVVKQITMLARGLEGERVILQPKHLLRDLVAILKETFPRDIQVKLDIPADLWTIFAEAAQFHHLMMNLCLNARDAMPGGGTLSVKAENATLDENFVCLRPGGRPGPFVLVTISDTGSGVSPPSAEAALHPLPDAPDDSVLAIAARIVKGHHGFMDVQADPGKGCAFRVYLPAADVNARSSAPPPEQLRGHGELILAVDDEASVREITKSTLEQFGYRCVTAADGTEAVGAFASLKNDVAAVLVDLRMPLMDGATTIRVLRRMQPDLKIVVSSGITASAEHADDHGVKPNAFLLKPYTALKLLTVLNEVLRDPAVEAAPRGK